MNHSPAATHGQCLHKGSSNCIGPYRVLINTDIHSHTSAVGMDETNSKHVSEGSMATTSPDAVDLQSTSICNIGPEEDTPKPLTEFTVFPNLPPEMRLRIWAAMCPGPRVVKIKSLAGVPLNSEYHLDFDFYADETKGIKTSRKVPIVMRINHESRYEGLKIYQLGLWVVNSPIRTYVSYKLDTILLDESRTISDEPFAKIFARLLSNRESQKIQHLALVESMFIAKDLRWFATFFRLSFCSLSELVLIVDESLRSRPRWLSLGVRDLKSELQLAFSNEKLSFPDWKMPTIVKVAPGDLEGRARITA